MPLPQAQLVRAATFSLDPLVELQSGANLPLRSRPRGQGVSTRFHPQSHSKSRRSACHRIAGSNLVANHSPIWLQLHENNFLFITVALRIKNVMQQKYMHILFFMHNTCGMHSFCLCIQTCLCIVLHKNIFMHKAIVYA